MIFLPPLSLSIGANTCCHPGLPPCRGSNPASPILFDLLSMSLLLKQQPLNFLERSLCLLGVFVDRGGCIVQQADNLLVEFVLTAAAPLGERVLWHGHHTLPVQPLKLLSCLLCSFSYVSASSMMWWAHAETSSCVSCEGLCYECTLVRDEGMISRGHKFN